MVSSEDLRLLRLPIEASGYRALSDSDNPRRQKVMPAEVHSVRSRLFMVNGET